MKVSKILLKLCVLFVTGSGAAIACDRYEDYTIDEIKEFRAMLGKEDADPLDRLFAFEQMVCSNRPNIRSYAIKQGLNTIQDPLVRNEVMFRSMMQKTRIDVELGTSRELTDEDKQFVAKYGGVYSKIIEGQSEDAGCIMLYRTKCDSNYSLYIIGDKVELNYGNVSGEFRLSANGELVGTMRADNDTRYTRIPAVIKLF